MRIKNLSILILFLISFSLFGQEESQKPTLKIGGALRFNYNLSDWKKEQVKRGGDFGFDVFRINVNAAWKKVSLNAEYRQYSVGFGGGMLKQGWMQYDFTDKALIQLGLSQVPFGIQKYNSHNWFFSLAYYVGLEDDHDMGLKYIYTGERLQWQLAFYKNAEELVFGDVSESSPNRYSYDVTGRNKEVNQGNLKLLYTIGDNIVSKFGASLMYGGLYNRITHEMGDRYAAAVHYELTTGGFNVKLQAATYEFNPEDSAQYKDRIAMGAYGFPYNIAAKANVFSAGIAYSVPVSWGPISNLQFYNDFSIIQKDHPGWEDSMENVLGCLVTSGQIYTYIDAAFGKNHPWLGPDWTNALADGNPEADWQMRFNINFGYYF